MWSCEFYSNFDLKLGRQAKISSTIITVTTLQYEQSRKYWGKNGSENNFDTGRKGSVRQVSSLGDKSNLSSDTTFVRLANSLWIGTFFFRLLWMLGCYFPPESWPVTHTEVGLSLSILVFPPSHGRTDLTSFISPYVSTVKRGRVGLKPNEVPLNPR